MSRIRRTRLIAGLLWAALLGDPVHGAQPAASSPTPVDATLPRGDRGAGELERPPHVPAPPYGTGYEARLGGGRGGGAAREAAAHSSIGMPRSGPAPTARGRPGRGR